MTLIRFRVSVFAAITLLALASAGQAAEPTKIPIRFATPGKGQLSLGVYDDAGTLNRSLTYAGEVDGGQQTLEWDGTTDLGLPAKPGTYAARGVWFAEPLKANFKMKVGVSGDPPYVLDNGLGGWGGNLGSPMDVCSDGKGVVAAFLCVESPNNTGVQLMDATGRIVRRYFTFFPWDVRFACAMDDTNMYLALASIGEKKLVVAKYDNDKSRGKILAEIPTGAATEPDGRWKGRWTTDVRGLALHAGRLYVPVFHDDKLAIVATADGKLLGMADVASPCGVEAFGDSIFLLSGSKLLKLDRDGRPRVTVIEAGLEDPSGLAIDADGNFYVSDRGAAQQVKVFSPAGRLIRTIGIDGGRPRNGLYNPKGLLDPRGLCVGPGGTLWVTESAEDFQRVSVWDARTGELRKEFFNTRGSSGQGRIDADRSEMVFSHGQFADVPSLAAFKIDLARGTWYPSWSHLMPQSVMQQEDVFLGNTHIYGQLATTFGGRHPYLAYTDGTLTADNGRLYAFGGEFSVWLLDPQTLEPKLAAFVYTHRAHKTQDGRFEGDFDQGPNNWLAWSDLNGDGKMAAGECVFTEKHPQMEKCSRLFAWQLQKDLSILMLCSENAKPLKWHLRRLPARQVLTSGVPVYDWADLQDVVTLDVPDFKGGDGWKDPVMGAFLSGLDSAGDSIFTLAEAIAPVPIKLGGIDGDGWWASRNWRRSPLEFDAATGKPAWLKLGRRAPGKARPGQMYFPNGICASIDGFVFVPDFIAQMHVWTDTGLYVGQVYHDPNDRIMDANSIFVELVGAYAYKIDGKVYTCTGDHGVSVHEIALPKLATVEAGTITVTPEMAAAARPWDPDGPPPGTRPVYVARAICEQDPQQKKMVNTRTIEIDGKLDDWAGVQAAEIMLEGKPVATLRTVFDAENLYLAYDVRQRDGLRNAGTELPLSPFASGGYVDFCIGRDWSNLDRDANAEGDVRVILARITGDAPADYQMAFWPVRKNGKNPQTISSPAATRSFADIGPLPGLRFAYHLGADGYTLEAAVPLKSLVLDPHRNPLVGFDASVGFPDAGGRVRSRAAHWAGQSEAAVVDRPGSAALLPATWGTLVFDRTPLK